MTPSRIIELLARVFLSWWHLDLTLPNRLACRYRRTNGHGGTAFFGGASLFWATLVGIAKPKRDRRYENGDTAMSVDEYVRLIPISVDGSELHDTTDRHVGNLRAV